MKLKTIDRAGLMLGREAHRLACRASTRWTGPVLIL